jgi:multiple antibiotic resistance protein
MSNRPRLLPSLSYSRDRLIVPLCILLLGVLLSSGLHHLTVEPPAWAKVDITAGPAIAQTTSDDHLSNARPGKRTIAQEIAKSTLEDEFNRFNLFIIFFVTLGPLKIIPVFVQLTRNASRTLRTQLAFRSTLISTVVILLVVIVGQNLIRVWQIQLPALMIAGGILLSLVSARLLLAQYETKAQQSAPPDQPDLSLAITPIAFPTILPPFGIAIALTLMIVAVQIGFRPMAVIGLLLLVMGLNLVSMLAARPIFKFIRPVTLRILGFTLSVMQFALGIQLVLSGIEVETMVIRLLLQGN